MVDIDASRLLGEYGFRSRLTPVIIEKWRYGWELECAERANATEGDPSSSELKG